MFKYQREFKMKVKKIIQAKYYQLRADGIDHTGALSGAIDYVFAEIQREEEAQKEIDKYLDLGDAILDSSQG